MRMQCDTLKYATILKQKGLKSSDANSLMSTFSEIEIFNIHSKIEVNTMLSESVEKVFAKHDQIRLDMLAKYDESLLKHDLKLAEQRREFARQLQEQRKEAKEHRAEYRAELLASRRWTIGTIITVGLSLAAYLSALIHYNH
jgi:hypothetical protein